jgi:uncharacterized membrane protein YqgA involved in biofilm formation
MLGSLINAGAVIVGGCCGLFLKNKLPEKYSQIYFYAVGLFTFVLGMQMTFKVSVSFLVVLSMIIGGLIGQAIDIDKKMNTFSDFAKNKLKIGDKKFTEGFISAFLLFCMGTMSIIGPIDEGLNGGVSELLKTKSLMDGFSSLLLTATLGVGVIFSAIPLLIYQCGITLISILIGSNIPNEYINQISAIGGILLIALSLNLLEIKKLPIMNLLPALIMICIFLFLSNFISYI